MIAICTGISGVGKRDFLGRLSSEHPDAIRLFDVGEMMLQVAEELNIKTNTEKILDMPETTQTALRSTVFEKIFGELDDASPDKHYIIGLHASFRWTGVLGPGFSAYHLKEITLRATAKNIHLLYVCFTDTACNIYTRLEQREQWKGKLDLEEILLWSNEEAVLTRMIAEYERATFVLLPVAEPTTSLWNILADPGKKKLYLSFPITIIKFKEKHLLGEVERFRERLREHFVVFDPLAIKDIEWLHGEYEVPDEVKAGLEIAPPACTDQAKKYMESQTVARDFQLINQSDFVVVYYKTDRASWGVMSEVIYGYSNNKPVYAVWAGSVSPFLPHYCTAWRPDIDGLLQLLTEKYC